MLLWRVILCLCDGRWFDAAQKTWRDTNGRIARWPDLLAAAHLDHNPANNRRRNLGTKHRFLGEQREART